MGKIITQTLNRFDGGVIADVRSKKANGAQLAKYFDILAYPSSLKPHNSSESGNDTAAREIQRFLFANERLYGLGVVSGQTYAKIFNKTVFTDDTWNEPSNSEASSLACDFGLFVFYSYGGANYLFGANGTAGTGQIWRHTIATNFTGNHQALNFTTINQGLVHSKDDILYIPYDNKIAKNNAGSWTTAALTLPVDYVIQTICEYGNYLAIGCAPLVTAGRQTSRVFLWDRDSTVTTLSESIEVGNDRLMMLAEYEGTLFTLGYLGKRVIARQYNGSGFKKVAEIRSSAVANPILSTRTQRTNDRLYFLGDITIDGTQHEGVWSFGRSVGGELAFSFDRTANNDTDVNSFYSFHFESVSGIDYMFVSYNDGAGGKQVSKTNDSATTFSASSVYETLINPIGYEGAKAELLDVSKKKDLVAVTVTHEPLPTAGSVTVKYKIDAETSWSSAIITNTTDDSLSASAVTGLPKDWKEIRFQITSTGGAVITGLKYVTEITGKDIYDA